MDCHAIAQKQVNNHLQSLYHLLKPSLITLMTTQPKIILQLAVFTRKVFHELYKYVQKSMKGPVILVTVTLRVCRFQNRCIECSDM